MEIRKNRYADRAGDRTRAENKLSEWDRVMKIVSAVPDIQTATLLLQLSRIRLIPSPTQNNTPQLIEEKIRARANEMKYSGATNIAKQIIDALNLI